MGRITVDGAEYDIERISRGYYSPSYILMISVSNLNEMEMPRHERERILNCNSRSQLTDDVIKAELERFLDTYPDAKIDGFGVNEEFAAREADRTNPPLGGQD